MSGTSPSSAARWALPMPQGVQHAEVTVASLDPTLLASLHRRHGGRHLAIGLGHLLMLAAALALAFRGGTLAWPAAIIAGILLFGCTVLLHEVVHRTVFARRRPRAERALA